MVEGENMELIGKDVIEVVENGKSYVSKGKIIGVDYTSMGNFATIKWLEGDSYPHKEWVHLARINNYLNDTDSYKKGLYVK